MLAGAHNNREDKNNDSDDDADRIDRSTNFGVNFHLQASERPPQGGARIGARAHLVGTL